MFPAFIFYVYKLMSHPIQYLCKLVLISVGYVNIAVTITIILLLMFSEL